MGTLNLYDAKTAPKTNNSYRIGDLFLNSKDMVLNFCKHNPEFENKLLWKYCKNTQFCRDTAVMCKFVLELKDNYSDIEFMNKDIIHIHARLGDVFMEETSLNDINELRKPNKNEYYSPWREDKRPINGVVHGIYVFSNVALALNEFKTNNASEEDSSLMARICDLISQVEQGIEEMKICPDILKLGRDIQNLSQDNIKFLYENIDLSQLDLSRKKISNRKKEKIANWN